MKEEKEEKRTRAKKSRDNFIRMLIEDTAIDIKTR